MALPRFSKWCPLSFPGKSQVPLDLGDVVGSFVLYMNDRQWSVRP